MSAPMQVKGGAATAISPAGDIKLILKLDHAWIQDIDRHLPFRPSLGDIKISINIEAGGVTSTYLIDHQTWPTTHSHNGRTHVFEETSPIRLVSIRDQEGMVELVPAAMTAVEPEPWKARHLIGKEWQEDEVDREVGGGRTTRQMDVGCPSLASTSNLAKGHIGVQRGKRATTPDYSGSGGKKQKASGRNEGASDMYDVRYSDNSDRPMGDPPKRFGLVAVDTPNAKAGSLMRSGFATQSSQQSTPRNTAKERRDLVIRDHTGSEFSFRVTASDTGHKVIRGLVRLGVYADDDTRLMIEDFGLWSLNKTVSDVGLWEDLLFGHETQSWVTVFQEQCGGKPVIYLYPPQAMSVEVNLSLCPQWTISAVYPPTQITKCRPLGDKKEEWERVKWDVDAQVDGSMLDKATGLETSYLFWEAETHPTTAGTKAHHISQSNTSNHFDSFEPCYTRLSPDQTDVVVLQSADVSIYLDQTLKALGLHTEARTSYITYWLPHYQRHPYIALTFLPQVIYSKAAPLDIVPLPKIVTRVFMLFQKVDANQTHKWTQAIRQAEEDVGFWRNIVGVAGKEGQEDKTLFRVLEWGGMEIR